MYFIIIYFVVLKLILVIIWIRIFLLKGVLKKAQEIITMMIFTTTTASTIQLILILAGCFPYKVYTFHGRMISLGMPLHSSHFTSQRKCSSTGPLPNFAIKYSNFPSMKPVLSWIVNFRIPKQLTGLAKPISIPSTLPVLGFGIILGTLFITLITKLITRKSQPSTVAAETTSEFVEVVAPPSPIVTEPIKVDIQIPVTEVVVPTFIPSPPPPSAVTSESNTSSSIFSSTLNSSLPSFTNPIKKWGNKGKGSRWSPGSLIKPKP